MFLRTRCLLTWQTRFILYFFLHSIFFFCFSSFFAFFANTFCLLTRQTRFILYFFLPLTLFFCFSNFFISLFIPPLPPPSTLFPCFFRGRIDSTLFLHRHRKHFAVVARFLVTTPTTAAPLTSFTQTTINKDNNKYFSGNAKHIDANQYHGQNGTFVRARGGIIHDQCKPTKGRQGQCHTSHKSSPIFTVRFKRSRL